MKLYQIYNRVTDHQEYICADCIEVLQSNYYVVYGDLRPDFKRCIEDKCECFCHPTHDVKVVQEPKHKRSESGIAIVCLDCGHHGDATDFFSLVDSGERHDPFFELECHCPECGAWMEDVLK